jgi:hypothetical protein
MYAETNAARSLGDHGASLEGIINALDEVFFPRNKETGREFWVQCFGVE